MVRSSSRCGLAINLLGSVRFEPPSSAFIGQIAETGTYVRQRREPLSFEVLTGVVGNSPFASHGHLLILRIVGYDARWS